MVGHLPETVRLRPKVTLPNDLTRRSLAMDPTLQMRLSFTSEGPLLRRVDARSASRLIDIAHDDERALRVFSLTQWLENIREYGS